MKKRNFEDEYNHHFGDYMTLPTIITKIFLTGILIGIIMMSLFVLVEILPLEMVTTEKTLQNTQFIITVVLLVSQLPTWNNLLTLVRYQPPKDLMKKMVLPIIIFYLSIGVGSLVAYLLANYGTDSRFTLHFIELIMFICLKEYFLYSKNIEAFKKERELEEVESQ